MLLILFDRLSLNRALSHRAQSKLTTTHMQLQRALDNEVSISNTCSCLLSFNQVHETVRLEEYRSYLEQVFGESSDKVSLFCVNSSTYPNSFKGA